MTESIEAKIEKLLRVADGTANENESSVALQMAQKLADAYNLDLGVIGKSGSRKDERVSKGLYKYQRTLYERLGDLNHCKVWVTKGLVRGSKYQTRLLGSKVNVTVTKNLCDYVEEVANRLVRERFEANQFFTKDAHLYREGFVDRMVDRIVSRRREEERERERERREQQARHGHPGAATENAIVLISDVRREEERANYDYLNGEGAWDALQERIRVSEEQRRKRSEQAMAEYEAWAKANPEEVKRKEEEARKDAERRDRENQKYWDRLDRAREKRRQERIDRFGYDPQDYQTRESKYNNRHYRAGQEGAETVSLDDQIDKEKRKGIA